MSRTKGRRAPAVNRSRPTLLSDESKEALAEFRRRYGPQATPRLAVIRDYSMAVKSIRRGIARRRKAVKR